jgi:predicted SprT family Zn-dependent metalloprotease
MVDNLSVSLSKIKLPKESVKEPVKETKEEMAIRLLRNNLNKNGLIDWKIRISKAVKKLGSCHYSKKTISLSSQFIEMGTETTILNTILHEIAHALCPGDGHGEKWKKKAIELGCDGKRCASGFKLKLQFNFECEKGCHASYARKCKTSDYLATGKAKCKKHSLFFYTVKDDIDDERSEEETEDPDDSADSADVIEEKIVEEKIEKEPIRLYSKYNYECKEGCFASYARKCKSTDFLATGTAKCKKHGLFFTVTSESKLKT